MDVLASLVCEHTLQVELTSPKDTFHAALQDYALSVLKEHRLRPLAEFAARLQFPLLRWLRSIRTKHGLFLDVRFWEDGSVHMLPVWIQYMGRDERFFFLIHLLWCGFGVSCPPYGPTGASTTVSDPTH